jgi:hypothetical protein
MISVYKEANRWLCQRVNGCAGGGGWGAGRGWWWGRGRCRRGWRRRRGGAGGDGGEDGDLVYVVVVEGLDVEGLVEGGLDVLGVDVDGAGQQRDQLQQRGVVVAGGGVVQGVWLGLGGLAFGLEFGEAFVAALAHGLGGGVGRIGVKGVDLGDLRLPFARPDRMRFAAFLT